MLFDLGTDPTEQANIIHERPELARSLQRALATHLARHRELRPERRTTEVARDTLAKVGWSLSEVDHVIAHQANQRILDAVADRLGMTPEKMPLNLQVRGNTSAASIPVLLDECNRAGRFEPGDKLLLVAFGGGLTWGAGALEWT